MHRFARLGAFAAAVALLAAVAGGAAADSQRKVLDSTLAGLPASMAGQPLFGVPSGGLPWRLDGGRAKLFANGHLVVEVEGLVLAAGPKEGTNPIQNGRAIVSCAGATAAMSSVVPFSPTGDAEVDETVSLPNGCLAPVIFFAGVPAPNAVAWFAVTGFGG